MDETQETTVVTDIEAVAKTLQNSIDTRLAKRKELIALVTKCQKQISDIDKVVSSLEKAQRKLRR